MLGTTARPHCSAAPAAMSTHLASRLAARSAVSFVTERAAGTNTISEMPVSTAFSMIQSVFSGLTRA